MKKFIPHELTITFTEEQVARLKVIQQSIDEPTTYRKILNGLLDVGYSTALSKLYESNRLPEELFVKGIMKLPRLLRDLLLEKYSLGPPNL